MSNDKNQNILLKSIVGLVAFLASIATIGAWVAPNFFVIEPEELNPDIDPVPEDTPPDSSQATKQPDEFKSIVFLVLEENGGPVEGAEVKFSSDGSFISKNTDESGLVELSLPTLNGVEITLSKDGFVPSMLKLEPRILDSTKPKLIRLERENDLPETEENSVQNPQDIWVSKSTKPKIPGLKSICYGVERIRGVETVFGYDNSPFYGEIKISSPLRNGCRDKYTFTGEFDLNSNMGRCMGEATITHTNSERFDIQWSIGNLGSTCPVRTSIWNIDVYPE